MDPSERTVPQPSASDTDQPRSDADRKPAEPPVDRSVSETTRFRVVSLHASGGMGHVFVARDDQLHRSVALKEIQEQFADDRHIRDRFLREAEVTGQLEHPGIVPVYAMGHYEDGRPYYVMRMIRGHSLKHAIAALHRLREQGDEHAYRLELRRLLNRFVTACNTIEYAHSRGVIHRDLKPDNIMLGPYGETLVVDWGLAKVIGSSDVRTDVPGGDDAVVQSEGEATTFGTVTGTPAYMSPEQALGWHDAIKPGSDIYSLGATLYSLLTGRPPLGTDDLGNLIVRIQKQDFRKPREINPSIPRPLEAICLKAMAPSASARYRTAEALAGDLEAFLAGEPVSAWREPFSVRAARWVRRHRTLVSTAAATAAVLLVALGVIVFLQNSANRRLSEANDRETLARKEAEAQRDKAQQNFQMAQDAVDRYFTQVSDDRRLAQHGLEPLRRDLLKSAGQFYERFVAQDPKAALRYDNAWAKFRLAEITDEIAAPVEAVAGYEQAAQTFRELIKAEGAPRLRDPLLMCLNNLITLYDRSGQHAKAEATLAEALAIARSLATEDPKSPPAQRHWARFLGIQASRLLDQGELAKSRASYREEIRVREQIVVSEQKQTYQLELAVAYGNLAVVEERFEQLAEAHRLRAKAISINRQLVVEDPNDAYLQHALALSLVQFANLAAREGLDDDARKAFREAVDLRTALVQRHPDVLEYRAALAMTADHFGVFSYDRGDFDAARTCYRQALTQAERLATDYPKIAEYQASLATTLANSANLAVDQNHVQLADQWLRQAIEIRKQLLHDSPNDLDAREGLASARLELATVDLQTKRYRPGEEHVRPAIATYRELVAAHPDRPFYAERLGIGLKVLGDLLKGAERDDQAASAYHEAQQVQRQLVAAYSNVTKHRVDLAMTCINLGNLCGRRGQWADAAAAFEEVIRLFPEASRATLGPQAKSLLETAYTGRAFARESGGDLDGMANDFEMAISLAPPARARMLRLRCATFLSADGRDDRALAIADPLVNDAALDGETAFELAVLYANSVDPAKSSAAAKNSGGAAPSGERAARVKRNIARAVSLLERAYKANYFADPSNRKKLQSAPFVPLLSGNTAFQKLLEATEKGPPAASQPSAAASR